MKIFAIVMAALLGCLALGWVATANDWAIASVFMPKMEQVRRNTFKQSQAYNDGMIQDLYQMKVEYTNADKDGKSAIGSVILHRYSVYPTDALPDDLQAFMRQLQHDHGQ